MTRHLFEFFSQLRFPYLFAITAIVFLLDLFIPDLVPMADEILLGLGAMLLSRIRKKQGYNQGTGGTPSYDARKTHSPRQDSHIR